jgi:type IV secretory pathway TraG/TraD family ATPase VirD4
MQNNHPLPPAKATILAVIVFVIFRILQRAGADRVSLSIWGIVVIVCWWQVARSLLAAYRFSRLIRIMATPTGLHGRTEVPTADDAETLGLSFSNESGNGIPLGGVGNKIIYYDGPGHASIRAATNSGKTASSSAPICFALGPHRNVIATAKGAELAFLTGPYRKDVLKQNVIYIDPWREMRGLSR